MSTTSEHRRLLALSRSVDVGEVNVVPALIAAGIVRTGRPKSRGTIREHLLELLLGLPSGRIQEQARRRRRAWPQTFYHRREDGRRERWITRTALGEWIRSFHRNFAPDVRRALDRIAA